MCLKGTHTRSLEHEVKHAVIFHTYTCDNRLHQSNCATMKAAVLLAIFSACIVLAQEDKCDALTDERGCLMGDCNWCASISVPSSCHSYDVASKVCGLPRRFAKSQLLDCFCAIRL